MKLYRCVNLIIFKKSFFPDSNINWIPNNNSILSNFSLKEIGDCASWVCAEPKVIDCKHCAFFFCRIGRIGEAIKGTFNKDVRAQNDAFRSCQFDLRNLGDTTGLLVSSDPITIKDVVPLDPAIRPRCEQLEALFKKYGVNDVNSLMLVINRPLLDRFKVSTIEHLRDTLMKARKENIELAYQNRSLSYDDFKYYVYNTSKLGWTNIDCFAGVPAKRLITLKINLNAQSNIDCKLAFQGRRVIMPSSRIDGQFAFVGVPLDQGATLVAIKYENGVPFLAMQDIMINKEPVNVTFERLTIQELKLRLKKLD